MMNGLKFYKQTGRLTLSTKLRSFQYRLINFAIVTNVQLCKWKVKDSPKCTFCNDKEETYLHLFAQCQTVHNYLWMPLQKWLNYFLFS